MGSSNSKCGAGFAVDAHVSCRGWSSGMMGFLGMIRMCMGSRTVCVCVCASVEVCAHVHVFIWEGHTCAGQMLCCTHLYHAWLLELQLQESRVGGEHAHSQLH